MAVSYLICTTPRSGSWLLCDALDQTELAGYPREYMLSHTAFDTEWGKPSMDNLPDYLARIREEATGPNGVCGIKLHWSQLQSLLGEPDADPGKLIKQLHEGLPGLRLIRLRRSDKLRQALSYHRALVRQQWWEYSTEPPSPADFIPDLAQVEQLIRLLARHEHNWDRFAAAVPSPPLELCYEELAADLPGQVHRVLLALGCNPAVAWSRACSIVPRLRRQADDRTELWVHQLLSRRRGGPWADSSVKEEM